MAESQVPDTVIGPARPSGADFFLPHRGAKSLDAAQVRIVHSNGPNVRGPSGGGSAANSGSKK